MTVLADDTDQPFIVDPDTHRQVIQSLSIGVALVDQSNWNVLSENACFFRWFPPSLDPDEPLTSRMSDFIPSRAQSRLESGRPYSLDIETSVGGRAIPIHVGIRPLTDDPGCLVVVECHDVSREKQAEYLLESYSRMAEKNARDIQREKDRVERLLLNIMPKSVYDEMKDYGTVTPQVFDSATILMLDFVGSTEMKISRDPGALITELNDIFTVFDRICEMFGCERIRTIGDAYMAVSGLPEPTPEHAHNVARVALRMIRYIERRNSAHPEEWLCRIGIHSGPVIGSLVGVQKYVYDIFGPGVNLAARMESLSEPMQITVSSSTYDLIREDFQLANRGEFEVKGFDEQTVYALERELPSIR